MSNYPTAQQRRNLKGQALASDISNFQNVHVQNLSGSPLPLEFWAHHFCAQVKSSNGGWYTVVLMANAYGKVTWHSCTCPDGQEGNKCKHQCALFYLLVEPFFKADQ